MTKSTQKALREHLESTRRAREQSDFVIPSEPKILRLVSQSTPSWLKVMGGWWVLVVAPGIILSSLGTQGTLYFCSNPHPQSPIQVPVPIPVSSLDHVGLPHDLTVGRVGGGPSGPCDFNAINPPFFTFWGTFIQLSQLGQGHGLGLGTGLDKSFYTCSSSIL